MIATTHKLAEAYDTQFFESMDHDARRSAEVILPLISQNLRIQSVIDFGCGHGEWLRIWKQLSAEQIVGVDGDFILREKLRIDVSEFVARDLRQPVDLQRRFDLVQSLEVAEHLPESCAEVFVDTLIAHGDRILFSAASQGQMGIQHVNEQPYDYWRDKFARRGYVLLDWIRPHLKRRYEAAFWYRYNTLFFVRQSALAELPPSIRESLVPTETAVPACSPFVYRLRCCVTKRLPVPWVDRIVRLSHRMESAGRAA